jgi:hypothetical protein
LFFSLSISTSSLLVAAVAAAAAVVALAVSANAVCEQMTTQAQALFVFQEVLACTPGDSVAMLSLVISLVSSVDELVVKATDCTMDISPSPTPLAQHKLERAPRVDAVPMQA